MKKHALLLLIIFTISSTFAQTGCVSGNCTDGNGTYRWDGGDTYVGDWINGFRTGYGRYDWIGGSYYVGNFVDNLLEGAGSYYDTDGSKMIGYFDKNEYVGEKDPNDLYDDTEDESYDNTNEDLDSLVASWDAITTAEGVVKEKAFASAVKKDFTSVLDLVIKDFANNFDNLKGAEINGILDLSNSYCSNLMIKGTTEAMINEGFLSENNSWYNMLYTDKNYENCLKKYEEYIELFQKSKVNCCSLVSDHVEYKGDSFESNTTYWLSFIVNDGFDEEIYSDLMVEIELSSSLSLEGYQILIRVSHLEEE